MNRRETERILGAIRQARRTGVRVAVATVVRVRGSAYRREGARILVREDGSYECLLSGGCLEPAVADVASRVIATGDPVVVEYDLAEDSVFGLNIGCSGAVDVLIERVNDDALTSAWLDVLERGDSAILVTPLAGAPGRLLVRDRDEIIGHLDDEALLAAAIVAARERLRVGPVRSGPVHVAGRELFFDVSSPPPELVIFGAGADAIPVARQGRDLGFSVAVVDPRAAMLTTDRFPGVTLRLAGADELATAVPLTGRSSVLVMNHHLERDAASLRHALGSDAPYIGVLGPRTRYARLLAMLEREPGMPAAERLARVRNPVGLALGAETPEEIAISILGELIALRRGFEAGFLTGRETSLHVPDDSSIFARS